ncbi:hypothetical protein FEJ81_13965 [Natrinema versiforme]|uniref:DUF8053 domain-containing protein n=1 Tax=Natrinema versiforme TaxID=88724 RepID=A0A4P8WJZ0_9EURY|nr:hypothetical protein FEJ81_13965 [Natrinema versiforme]
MPIHKLVQVGRTSGGVVLPKSELRALGCVDEDGNVKDQPVRVTRTEDRTWKISLIDSSDFPKDM